MQASPAWRAAIWAAIATGCFAVLLAVGERAMDGGGAMEGRRDTSVRVGMRELLASKTGRRKVYLRGKTVSARFCALDENAECDLEGYAFYIAGIVLPCILFGVICLIAIPCFCIIRMCCAACCSGGATRYKRRTIIMVKAGLALLLFGVGLAFFFGYAGNKKASDGIRGLTRLGVSTGESLVARIERIRARILSTSSAPADAGTTLQDAIDSGNDFLKSVREADDKVATVNSWRFAAINIGFIFPSLFAVLSFLLGMANLRLKCIHLVFAMIVLFALFLLWISTGLHWLVEILFGDLCFEARDFLFTPQPDRVRERNPLESIFHCSANDTDNPFRSLATTLDEGIENAVTSACFALTDPTVGVCNHGVDCAIAGYPSEPCEEATLERYSGASLYSDRVGAPPSQLTLIECSSSSFPCVPGVNRTAAEALETSLADIIIYRNLLRGDIEPLLECDFLRDLLLAIDGVICTNLVGGFGDIRKSQLSAAIFFVVIVVFMILGQKRFVPLSESLEADENKVEFTDDPPDAAGAELVPIAPAAVKPGAQSFLSSSTEYSTTDSDYALPVYDAAPFDPNTAPPPTYDGNFDSLDHGMAMDFDNFESEKKKK